MKTLSLIFLFYIFILINAKELPFKKWNVKVTDENRSGEPIKIHPGRYTKILLTLEQDSLVSKIFPLRTSFFLKTTPETSKFKTSKNHYQINTLENNEYEVYLGMSCTDITSDSTTYTLSFKAEPLMASFFTFSDFTVEVIIESGKIDFEPTLTKLPPKSLAEFKLRHDLYNVDEVKIKFERSAESTGSSNVPEIVIKKFSEEKDLIVESSLNGFIGEYRTEGEFEEGKTFNIYSISVNNQCFELPSTQFLEFTTVNETLPTLDESIKKKIVNSIQSVAPKEGSAIEITVDIPVAPVRLHCGVKSGGLGGGLNNDEEVIEQKGTQDEGLRYQKYLITEPQEKMSIKFTELSRIGKYNLKCVIQNMAKKDNKSYSKISFSIGKFKEADIVKVLTPSIDTSFVAQCGTWTFSKNVDVKKFIDQAVDYCEYSLNSGATSRMNGCVQCKGIELAKKSVVSICASSFPICKTSFKGDSKALFKQFVFDLDTEEKIKENLEGLSLLSYPVEKTNIELDEIAPDTRKINVALESKEKNKAIFTITSTNEQNIECEYNNHLTRDIGRKWITPEFLHGKNFILEPNKAASLTVTIGAGLFDNKSYNLFLDCHNLPGYKQTTYSTGVFAAYTFLLTEEQQKDYEKKEKNDCTKNVFSPQCIKKAVKKVVKEFKSKMPEILEEIEDDVDDFERLSNVDQLIKLKLEETEFKNLLRKGKSAIKQIINQAIKLAQYLHNRNCLEVNDYDECRLNKKEIQSLVISQLKETFSCANIIENLTNTALDNSIEQNLKYLLILLADASANADSLKEGESKILYDLGYCVLDKFEDIWAKVQSTISKTEEELKEIKKDVKDLLVKAINNLGDIINYDEVDGYLSSADQALSDAELLIGETAKKAKEKINQVVKLLWEYGNARHELGNINININITVSNAQVQERRLTRSLEGTDDEKEFIDFPDQGVKIGLYVNKLAKNFNAELTQIFVYDKYPLLSVKNTKVSPHFLSIKLFDKNGNEIDVSNIEDKYLPEIYFNKTITGNNFGKCYYYNEQKEDLKDDGITVDSSNNDYVVCKVKHFTDFTIGEVESGSLKWWAILLIVLACAALVGGIIIAYICLRKKNVNQKFIETSDVPMEV